MLALETLIANRLKTQLPSPWQVQGQMEAGDRRVDAKPLALVGFEGMRVAGTSQLDVRATAVWGVQLLTRRGTGAHAVLDAGLAAAIGALHNWRPQPSGPNARKWGQVAFQRADYLPEAEDALTGVHLFFETSVTYAGTPPSTF